MTRRLLIKTTCGALLATTLAACGGAAESSSPKSPPASVGAPSDEASDKAREPQEPRTVAEAQAQIAQAKDELSGKLDLKKDARSSETENPNKAPAPSPPKSEPSASSSRREEAGKGAMSDDALSACSGPCRALASMKRAVSALCRMTGDGDSRCLDARKTLADSEGKLPSCHCS